LQQHTSVVHLRCGLFLFHASSTSLESRNRGGTSEYFSRYHRTLGLSRGSLAGTAVGKLPPALCGGFGRAVSVVLEALAGAASVISAGRVVVSGGEGGECCRESGGGGKGSSGSSRSFFFCVILLFVAVILRAKILAAAFSSLGPYQGIRQNSALVALFAVLVTSSGLRHSALGMGQDWDFAVQLSPATERPVARVVAGVIAGVISGAVAAAAAAAAPPPYGYPCETMRDGATASALTYVT